mmetsp:Transcript_116855/g.371984  ORF Transcript_116855/g.371984 Transcript_116855/m.371984 type:complete len:269 (-) Transcript_116855:389-1195(-)
MLLLLLARIERWCIVTTKSPNQCRRGRSASKSFGNSGRPPPALPTRPRTKTPRSLWPSTFISTWARRNPRPAKVQWRAVRETLRQRKAPTTRASRNLTLSRSRAQADQSNLRSRWQHRHPEGNRSQKPLLCMMFRHPVSPLLHPPPQISRPISGRRLTSGQLSTTWCPHGSTTSWPLPDEPLENRPHPCCTCLVKHLPTEPVPTNSCGAHRLSRERLDRCHRHEVPPLAEPPGRAMPLRRLGGPPSPDLSRRRRGPMDRNQQSDRLLP